MKTKELISVSMAARKLNVSKERLEKLLSHLDIEILLAPQKHRAYNIRVIKTSLLEFLRTEILIG